MSHFKEFLADVALFTYPSKFVLELNHLLAVHVRQLLRLLQLRLQRLSQPQSPLKNPSIPTDTQTTEIIASRRLHSVNSPTLWCRQLIGQLGDRAFLVAEAKSWVEQSATINQDRLFVNNIPASNQDLFFSVSLTADLNLSFLLVCSA